MEFPVVAAELAFGVCVAFAPLSCRAEDEGLMVFED
jgi:hypothetical protein